MYGKFTICGNKESSGDTAKPKDAIKLFTKAMFFQKFWNHDENNNY